MSEAKHTPGPWEAVLADDPRGQPVPYYRGLVALVESRVSVVAKCGYVPKENWEANARLIAAAPALLALLKELIDIEGPQPGNAEWARKVGAEIAKAEGRA
jgi:hypothetical protein